MKYIIWYEYVFHIELVVQFVYNLKSGRQDDVFWTIPLIKKWNKYTAVLSNCIKFDQNNFDSFFRAICHWCQSHHESNVLLNLSWIIKFHNFINYFIELMNFNPKFKSF